MSGCLFCSIAAGEADATVLGESEHAVAFADINAAAPTHALVIPKEHIASADELNEAHDDLLADVFALIRRVASDAGVSQGYRIVTNVGPEAGQSVPHLHFHVLGGRSMGWPPG